MKQAIVPVVLQVICLRETQFTIYYLTLWASEKPCESEWEQ